MKIKFIRNVYFNTVKGSIKYRLGKIYDVPETEAQRFIDTKYAVKAEETTKC